MFSLQRRVSILEWHPTAENVLLSASHDHSLILWNVARGDPVQVLGTKLRAIRKVTNCLCIKVINCHLDTIYSMSFNRNGSLVATTCKDKQLRVIQPRTREVVTQVG